MDVRQGDRLLIDANKLGQARRSGEVTRVAGDGTHQRMWVRWDDGHESLFMPGPGVQVEHPSAER